MKPSDMQSVTITAFMLVIGRLRELGTIISELILGNSVEALPYATLARQEVGCSV